MSAAARLRLGACVLALAAAGCAHGAPWTPPEGVAAQDEYAWRLLHQRCRSCHALPDPRRHSPERWAAGIEKMRGRLALPDSDWVRLLALVPPLDKSNR